MPVRPRAQAVHPISTYFMAVVTMAAAIAATTLIGFTGTAAGQTGVGGPTLNGSATYRERSALPLDAVFEAAIHDVTPTGFPPDLIGRIRIAPAGQVPIRFTIPYDSRLVERGRHYELRARITGGGRLLFATEMPVTVFPDGRAAPVDLMLSRAHGPASAELAPPTYGTAPSGATQPAPRFRFAPPQPTGVLGALPATFTGVLPCADCAGIRHDLNLEPDGGFELRTQYLGRSGEPVFTDRGRWDLDRDGRRLTLSGGRDRPMAFAVNDPTTLRLLDLEGREIVSSMNYDLRRTGRPHAGMPPSGAPQSSVPVDDLPWRGTSQAGDAGPVPLRGVYWRLIQLGTQPAITPPGQREPNLILNPDVGRYSGNGGCNGIAGGFSVDGGRIGFGPGTTTMMACGSGMEQERAYLDALERAESWSIRGNRLTLYGRSGDAVAEFDSR